MDARNHKPGPLTAEDVLRRYKDELLPAFSEVPLDDVNQVGNFGERPLHVASSRGNIDEMTALLEAGAEVNAPGDIGNTPLHEAVGQGHVEAIRLLLKHGADPNRKNELGQNVFDKAALTSRDNVMALLRSHSG